MSALHVAVMKVLIIRHRLLRHCQNFEYHSNLAPFGSTGVDFAGPLYIRYPGNKNTSKVWLCLFTCAVIRAVHLDLVPDMSTSAFLRCLKRFVARRGIPQRIMHIRQCSDIQVCIQDVADDAQTA